MAADSKGKAKTFGGSKWRKLTNISGVGSKEKGQGFAHFRKQKALREYKKLLKKTRHEKPMLVLNTLEDDIQSNLTEPIVHRGSSDATDRLQETKQQTAQPKQNVSKNIGRAPKIEKRKTCSKYHDAQEKFKRQKIENEQLKKEKEKEKEKKIAELQESLKRRRETHKQLTKRTQRGQPVMANQISHLLQKIQSHS
ncbi:predicted protein [Nematostella vectensis]|uniref:rRNA-processing protein FYV7 n=1 Tax=Nematostella vectensis TaxID=45351 RepID=A7SBI1_NEMVE|nr:predicted protein [Nematostella vectensis]|eukprot:XP_001631011.1 predicted protein [Nematostella vectensis]